MSKYKLLVSLPGLKKGQIITTNDPFRYFYFGREKLHMPSHPSIFKELEDKE